MIIDATAILVKTKYPQDAHLLNQACLSLEVDLKAMSKQLKIAPPRTYKREAHKIYGPLFHVSHAVGAKKLVSRSRNTFNIFAEICAA